MTSADAAVVMDDPAQRAAIDLSGALTDVEATPEQWEATAELGGEHLDLDGVRRVVVLGMGGSGISGDVIAAIAEPVLDLPFTTHKGYGLPAGVDRHTLLIAASFSGNTEETLSGVQPGLDRGARLFAVTSGGELGRVAAAADAPHVIVPGGGQPRHSLGKLVVPMLAALGLDADLDEAIAVQREVRAAWGSAVPFAENPGKQLGARSARGPAVHTYGPSGLAALAAVRLKCQYNENAKLPAYANVVPELCHNEVIGWEDPSASRQSGIVWFADDDDHPRDTLRVEVLRDVFASSAGWQETISASGTSPLARLASLVFRADLASVYAALARRIDPTPIQSIDILKSALAEQPQQNPSSAQVSK